VEGPPSGCALGLQHLASQPSGTCGPVGGGGAWGVGGRVVRVGCACACVFATGKAAVCSWWLSCSKCSRLNPTPTADPPQTGSTRSSRIPHRVGQQQPAQVQHRAGCHRPWRPGCCCPCLLTPARPASAPPRRRPPAPPLGRCGGAWTPAPGGLGAREGRVRQTVKWQSDACSAPAIGLPRPPIKPS